MLENNYQVIIIGGGIVGLSASLFLSSHSIPHLLIERHPTTSIHPRARGLNTRAMEIFRTIGVDELVREAGADLAPSMGICKGTSFISIMEPRKRKESKEGRGEMPLAFLARGVSPTKGCRCTQDCMEPVLVKAARERGGELRYNTLCEGVEQDERGVTVTLRNQDKDTISTVRAEYLIAADGAGSPIRKQLGIGTTGKGALGHLLNILFHADLSSLVRGREISFCTISRPEVPLLGLLTAIDNKSTWVFHLSYDPLQENASSYTPERCEELLKTAIGIPDLKIAVKSILPWTPADICAEKFRDGRIFLAGDAAHQTTPYGGQGATTGIADVFDLSWKLAQVFKGTASEKLLETYEQERLPVGRFVAKESGELADAYGLPEAVNRGKWAFLISVAMRIPMYAGFGYRYTNSQAIINEEGESRWTWWWNVPWTIPSLIMGFNGRPGTRVPHLWVQHVGRQISTLDLFGTKSVLLAGSEGKGWCQAAAEVAEKLDLNLEAYRVGPTSELSDPKKQWDTIAGVSSQGALLVRPDGFVAWRVKDQEGDLRKRLQDVVEKILCR
ncbi:related to phenol 2-monooxygenase [Phialocephala subalpina]|uniref:Related to phenol 2-monooxygenase n=1 Tax=Phialocephala subalpina TaxID=576137 RepID=A0A1L7WI36_9HELO|nr:related to phenol 2-monooxygenase [Phialocephala subalpina]